MSSQRDRQTSTHKAPATHLLGGRGSGGGGPPGLHEQGLSCQQRVLHEAQISPRPPPASIPRLRHLEPDSGLERDPALALPTVWKSPRPAHMSLHVNTGISRSLRPRPRQEKAQGPAHPTPMGKAASATGLATGLHGLGQGPGPLSLWRERGIASPGQRQDPAVFPPGARK